MGRVNLNLYRQVKEAHLKRLQAAWFKPYGFLEEAHCGDSTKISGFQGRGGGRNELADLTGLLGSEIIPYVAIAMDVCHYTFVQTYRMHNIMVTSDVNYGRWVVMMGVNVGLSTVTNVPCLCGC